MLVATQECLTDVLQVYGNLSHGPGRQGPAIHLCRISVILNRLRPIGECLEHGNLGGFGFVGVTFHCMEVSFSEAVGLRVVLA